MTPEQIEAMAKANLSSYAGTDKVGYTGQNDAMLSFAGKNASSFANEGMGAPVFTFKLKNASAATVVLAMGKAFYASAADAAASLGETIDGLITDGTIITNVTAVAGNSRFKLAHILEFARKNAMRLIGFTIQTNTQEAFKENLTIVVPKPFATPDSNTVINLQDQVRPEFLNQNKIEIPVGQVAPDLQLDDQAIILIPIGGTNVIAGGVELGITLKFGAIANTAGSLATKARVAKQNVTAAYRAGLLK